MLQNTQETLQEKVCQLKLNTLAVCGTLKPITFLEASLHRLVGRIIGMVTLLFVLMVCFWLVCLYRIESGAWPYGEKGESKGNVYHTDEKQTSTLKTNELCPKDQ